MIHRLEPGQTYTAGAFEPIFRTVLSRVEEDDDWTDGWGSKGGRSPHGWYWRFLDLCTGQIHIMIDNQFNDQWELL